jgi:dihydrofolate synthase/folylpolyglutamate synthase
VAAQARSVGLAARPSGSVSAALEEIAQQSWPTPPRILICGSLHLAGAVLRENG